MIRSAALAALAAHGRGAAPLAGKPDQVAFIQQQLTVNGQSRFLVSPTEQAVAAGAHGMFAFDAELAESDPFNRSLWNFSLHVNETGHLHHMARRSRWIGWRHLSEGHHTNGKPSHHHLSSDVGIHFFQSAPAGDWITLLVVCVILCFFDALVLRRAPSTFVGHLTVIGIWVLIAALYLWDVWARMGRHHGIEWISGYVLEWMLSMDNLFIFHLVFQSYRTPQDQIHKAVFVGIIGAVVMRLVFFMVVSSLLHAVGWFRWPFGAMLIWSGIEAVRGEDDDDMDVKDTRLVRALRWCCGNRILDGYDTKGTSIFIWDKNTGQLHLSLLFVVIFIVEFSDIVFALDSVSAKVAQIPNQYVAFSSSVMAMYGLRAMFFIIQDLVEMFELLKYGLGLILVLIGVELMFGRWLHISSGIELALIVGIFVVCIAASIVKTQVWPKEEEVAEEGEPKGEAEEEFHDAKEVREGEEGPLSDLHLRPEGEEVDSHTANGRKAWTIHEGRRTSSDEKDVGSSGRAHSQPAQPRKEK